MRPCLFPLHCYKEDIYSGSKGLVRFPGNGITSMSQGCNNNTICLCVQLVMTPLLEIKFHFDYDRSTSILVNVNYQNIN